MMFSEFWEGLHGKSKEKVHSFPSSGCDDKDFFLFIGGGEQNMIQIRHFIENFTYINPSAVLFECKETKQDRQKLLALFLSQETEVQRHC